MPGASERLRLIRQVAGALRRNAADFDPEELEFAASEIEREAELALADLEVGTPAARVDWPVDASRLLSAREIEVLSLVSNGLPDKQIAKRLGISTFTVNKHVGAILLKMEASSRTEASVRAIMEGFLHPRAS
jgi:DNA-binding NarL/FixJ family response regulator